MYTVHRSDRSMAQLLDSEHLLAAVTFDGAPQPRPADPRQIITPLACAHAGTEVWTARSPVTTGREGNISFARSAEMTVGTLILPHASDNLCEVSQAAFRELLDWLPRQRHNQLWRTWNVFAEINDGGGDRERYREFCRGRHQAFTDSDWQEAQYPAASAIGGHVPQLFIMFLAGVQPSQQIENPRQVSAYHYPRQYGPRSPSFARASIISAPGEARPRLLVSGTASVVGHASRHIGDSEAQAAEIMRNLDSLLAQTRHATRPEAFRVYARSGTPAEPMIRVLQSRWGKELPVFELQGDICRRELLLEVEGIWALEA